MKSAFSVVALFSLAGCAAAPAIRYSPATIPPSLVERPAPPPIREIQWPRSKNGKGITRNATTTYDYEDDREYRIRACFTPLLTYIYLQPGERHSGEKAAIIGDSDNWKVAAKLAGNTEIIAVSGNAGGLRTSMMIATDMREYAFDLVGSENCQRKIRFAYKPSAPRQTRPAQYEVYDPSRVNANYVVSLDDGDTPWWMPLGAFDMGNGKTWIELPGLPGNVGMPLVLVSSGRGVKTPATARADGNFIQVDALFGEAELGLDGSVVTVRRAGNG